MGAAATAAAAANVAPSCRSDLLSPTKQMSLSSTTLSLLILWEQNRHLQSLYCILAGRYTRWNNSDSGSGWVQPISVAVSPIL